MSEDFLKSPPIIVKASDFGHAIRTLTKTIRKPAKCSCRILALDNRLFLSIDNTEIEIACKGSWPGNLIIPGKLLKPLIRFVKERGNIVIQYDQERAYFGNFSIPYVPIKKGPLPKDLANLTLMERYALSMKYSYFQLNESGCASDYIKAVEQIDSIIEKAMPILKTLYISRSDLRKIVQKKASRIEDYRTDELGL